MPWPFPGDYKEQTIVNNYQQATDDYIHSGLDFVHRAGTSATAVDSGYVAAIVRNPAPSRTHDYFIITPKKGGNEGWCYTHMDSDSLTFKEGDFVRQGRRLGSLARFSVNGKPGDDHLHLSYVRFNRNASGTPVVHSLLDPLYFFDYKDTERPIFQRLRFVTEGTLEEFRPDAAGVVTVNGKVDVLAAISDTAIPGQFCNFGVPLVMLSISDGNHTVQKLVLDHRGDVGDEKQTKPLYLSVEERRTFFDPLSIPRYQMLRVTKSDGDGKITPRDAAHCWDTRAKDGRGKPQWPNGRYSVNVYAWDIAGNREVQGAYVQVDNKSSRR